jgi:2-hydroxychromene-2-carboxylate isomerase
MGRIIEYYFSMHSPWAYIGHVPFLELVGRFGLNVSYKPISLPKVFAETGGLPVTKRHPARLRYRMVELQRWREKRRLNFKLRPKFFPFEAELADRFVITVAAAGYDPDSFLRRAFAALWEDEQDLADDTTLMTLGDATGLPGWRTPKAPKPNQRTAKMLWTRLQRMSSAHLLMYSTARCFGVKTELIFLRAL